MSKTNRGRESDRRRHGGHASWVNAIVGIGMSVGDLTPIAELFRHLPPDTGMAFVVVPQVTSSTARIGARVLAPTTSMPVVDVRQRTRLHPNQVYVAPPDAMMTIAGGFVSPVRRPRSGASPIDAFFESLAHVRRHAAIGVVLSGTGSAGVRGLQAIQQQGGITFADDTPTADFVLRPAAIARELAWIARHPLLNRPPARARTATRTADVRAILRTARGAFDAGATLETGAVVERRILRRMIRRGFTDLASYDAYLRQRPDEIAALTNELAGGDAVEELKRRNLELTRVDTELQHLLGDLDLPLVVVDRELRVQRFTAAARRMVNVIALDIERPITDLGWNVVVADVDRLLKRAIETGSVETQDVQDREGRRYRLSIRPDANRAGAVIALADVDAVASARAAAEEELDLHHAVTKVLIGAETLAVGTAAALQVICQRTTWARGQVWAPNLATKVLEPISAWCASYSVRTAKGPAAGTSPPAIDRSVAEHVWRTGDVVWRSRRSKWRTAFGCRIEAPEPVGVMLLFADERRARDAAFGSRMKRLSSHIGAWVACKALEETLRGDAEEYRQLAGRLLDVQDDERRRLARELHDSTAQTLAALTMNLDHLEAAESSLGAQWRGHVSDSRTLATQSADKVRAMAYLLHPPLLDEMGLASALRWYAADFTERTGIVVDLDLEDVARSDPRIERALFRVVQESLTNVHEHSGSQTASVTLDVAQGSVRLQIRDRGRGLRDATADRAAARGRTGIGIPSMRERIRQLSGTFEIEFTNRGTTVRVRVPLTTGSP